MVVKKADEKGQRRRSTIEKSKKDDKRRKSSVGKKAKSRHSHHDQREEFERLEASDEGYKGQLEAPKHHHHKTKSQLEIPGAEPSHSGSHHSHHSKKSHLEIPGAELSRSGSHHSHHSHNSQRVNSDEDEGGKHHHHHHHQGEDNTDEPRRKSIHMDYTPEQHEGRRHSKHYKVDTDEETRHGGAKRNSDGQTQDGEKHRRKSSTETGDKHRRKSSTEKGEKHKRRKSIVQDDEKGHRRKSIAEGDEKGHRRRSIVQDDEKGHRRKSIVQDDEKQRKISVPKDNEKHHRRKSIVQDDEKHHRRKSIVQEDEKHKDTEKHHRRKSIGQDDEKRRLSNEPNEEKHRRKSIGEDGQKHHGRRKSIGHDDEKHQHHRRKSHGHAHGHDEGQGHHTHTHPNNVHGERDRRESIKEKVTFSEVPPQLPPPHHGHGPQPHIKVIPLLAEGTQTHPVPKPPRVDENNQPLDEELLAPYWQTELDKGREHLRLHQQAYLRAHGVVTKTALRPSEEEIREEKEFNNRSTATIFPGALPEGVSPGLVHLNQIDRIFFQHRIEVVDGIAVCFDKKKNIYEIINGSGHKMFRMEEETSKKCCGLCSGLEISFLDSNDREVIRMIKKVKLTQCRAKFEMYSPPGHLIGSIEQAWNYRTPEFRVKDFEGTVIMIIKFNGTLCCGFGKSKEMSFMITTTRGNPRGRVAGDWPDLKRTTFSTEDAYGVHFPGELNVIWKTLVVGGAFMVYQKYYDGMQKVVHHRVGHTARALVDFQVDPSRRSSKSTVVV